LSLSPGQGAEVAELNRINILEDLYAKDSSDIDPTNLAKMLGVNKKELAAALKLDPSVISRSNIAPTNKTVKNWLVIFNLIIDLFQQEEPQLPKDQIQIKMSRWLKLPNTQLGNVSPIDTMLKGKARKVIHLLEQLNS
jgi:hypothetical protein